MPREPDRRLHRLPHPAYANPRHVFSFTICAAERTTPFADELLAEEVIRSLLWTKERYGWLLFAYCLMPDHLHFIGRLTQPPTEQVNLGVNGSSKEGVLEHVGRFKSYTTHRFWERGGVGRLWQRSSYDRLTESDRDLEQIVGYILSNPVRAGLVDLWQEWPHSRIVDSL